MQNFGLVLKDLRTRLGLSQAALAGKLGSTQRHISFVETGRSNPSSGFLMRICRELNLSIAERANLFEASGLPCPYPRRELSSAEVTATLTMIETHVLRNWPFPALVLDAHWNILRQNSAFTALMAPFMDSNDQNPNLLNIFLSPQFSSLISNFDEVAPVIYNRMQKASVYSHDVAKKFGEAKSSGMFDTMDSSLASGALVPAYTPINIALPDGTCLQIGSLMGRLASVQDALVEGFEIELMVPADKASDDLLRSIADT